MSEREMKRREFLKVAGAGAASLALIGPASGTAPGDPPPKRPNLLIIHTDQQSCWTLGTYGGTLIETPHIDGLAREGARLDAFFVNSAVCTPSRGSMLTGRYPHSHGAWKNNLPLDRNERTLAHVLRDAGYDTGYAGKWHLDGDGKPGWMKPDRSMGFDDCRFMYNRGHWKSILEKDGALAVSGKIGDGTTYTTDWLAARTIDFVKSDRENPFFFMVSIPDPHTPFSVRAPYDTMFDPAEMTIPSTFHEKGGPEWLVKARGKNRNKPGAAKRREETLRRRKAQYCGEVKCIDDAVGRIVDALREKNLLDDTLIVFTTDHGEYMGEHGIYYKNNLYETAYRVPMILRWPRRIAAGTVVDNVTSSVDVMPTLLALMEIAPSGREQGRNACPLIAKESGPDPERWADEAFIHHSSLERAGIFTPRWELALVKDGDHILFDRREDPEQTKNLFGDPEHAGTVKSLLRRIVAHNRDVDAPAAAWLEKIEGTLK